MRRSFRKTAEVSEILRIRTEHDVPAIAFGTGTSLEGQLNAPAGGVPITQAK